jgi:hypothetical protein
VLFRSVEIQIADVVDSANSSNSLFYNLIHILDDIYVYGRTVIENNYFNLADNADFNLVYPNIYIGNYSTSTNLELLQNLGITNIISVIPTFNPPFPDNFKYLHISAYDDESQDMSSFFQTGIDTIKEILTNKGKILIHCMVGRSRSVTIFLAFLISFFLSLFLVLEGLIPGGNFLANGEDSILFRISWRPVRSIEKSLIYCKLINCFFKLTYLFFQSLSFGINHIYLRK